MICAVTTFASSIYNYALENAIYIDGDWHGAVENTDFATYQSISTDDKIENSVYAQQLGYAKIEGCKNENKPYLFVLGASDGFQNTMPVHVTNGDYPKNTSEILIPEHLYANGGVELSIGDTLELELGKRMLDGYQMTQNNPFYVYDENNDAVPSGETLKVEETRIYTVVGFYERPSFEDFAAPGYTAITLADKTANSHGYYSVWFKMNKVKDTHSFIEEKKLDSTTDISACTWNSSVLRYSGVSRYDGFNSMIISLSVIVIGLIMLGSISLIYNAFSISVAERTKQFGLLSSVGATKKQLKQMVITEALMVSAVGIPLGIIAGVGGIGITLIFIGNKFQTLIGYPIPLKLSVSGLSLIIAVLVALLTVIISAVIPSMRATKVSAIEAIRQSKDINTNPKKIRISKLTYKLFGLSGMLASKYYKRSKKKYRATVLSLFMSIVLFISAAAFTGALTESVTDSFGKGGYDILVFGNNDAFENITADELLNELKKDKGVEKATYTQDDSLLVTVSQNNVSKDFLNYYSSSEGVDIGKLKNVGIYAYFKFVDDTTYKELLEYVKEVGNDNILTSERAAKLEDVDCIIVLGCQVKDDGMPSDMLRDRLTRGIELYELGAAPKLLMSGDHGREEYNEVGTMKQYAIDTGVSSEDVFMDHAGFSTYESVCRAKEIFGADKVIIVTQEYHLYRALYIADKLGIEAYGVSSDYHTYAGQSIRECREILARCKDFVTTIFKLEPTYLGETIPVSGNGDVTND